ncbi:putative peptidase [Bacillus sp. TS-2]|nr:putative peptidase [Bacillus sp. TS-2]
MNPLVIKAALTLAQYTKNHWKEIVIILLSFLFLIFIALGSIFGNSGNSGSGRLSQSVLAWEPVVRDYANEYGIPEYVDVLLAIMMVESRGEGLDVMQSSESLGLPPNTITDPIFSIETGVSHFAKVIEDARSKELDFWTPVQSYNFGQGFNNFVSGRGKEYSFDLASEFSKKLGRGREVKYSNPIADFNGNYRYAYGNMYYVLLIQQFLQPVGGIGNSDASSLGAAAYEELMNEVMKYNGWGYVWGGANPGVGFDCSGLIQYAYRQIGVILPRTAAEQYRHSVPISNPQPGDLVFFKGTNSSRPSKSITHVGIYIDENRMFDASNSGIGYSNWSTGYWARHFAGFGRVN